MQCEKQRKRYHVLFDIKKNVVFFSPQDMFILFDSIVKSILCYGAGVWGYQFVEFL